MATRIKPQFVQHIPLVVKHIMNGNIRNEAQLQASIDFLLHHSVSNFTEDEFKKACGVGVVISIDQIEDEVVCSQKFQTCLFLGWKSDWKIQRIC